MSTAYHAKYFAFELTKRCASDIMEKLAASLADAQVDLNPHQVEASLFAFRSPLSKGAILADEVQISFRLLSDCNGDYPWFVIDATLSANSDSFALKYAPMIAAS